MIKQSQGRSRTWIAFWIFDIIIVLGGCRDNLEVQSAGCSPKGLRLGSPAPTWRLTTTICKSSPREYSTFFWPLQAPDIHIPHRFICRPEYPYIHKKKKNYLRLRQVIMRSDCCFEKNKEQDLKKNCNIFILLMGANYKKAFRRYTHRSSQFLHSTVTQWKS